MVGPLEEPLLLLVMGSLFLVLGRFFATSGGKPAPGLATQRRPA